MPSGTLAPRIKWYETDADGDPLAGGKVTFYLAGSTTKVDTYADRALTVPNSNPVILDAAGRATVFFSATTYRVVVTDANDVQQYDQDDCVAVQGIGGSSGVDDPVTAGQDVAINALCYISDGSDGLTQGRAYKADAALAYASIDAKLGFATDAILSGVSGFLRGAGTLDGFSGLVAGSTYYVSTVVGEITATPPANARSIGRAISATTLLIEQSPSRPSVISPLVCQGRLTLTTALPVTIADVTAAVTLYFAPYKGNRVDLFDGARWNRRTFTQLSIAIPAAANQMYDVFLVDTAGVLSLELLAWTNDTTRATALAVQDGMLVKTGALTRLYLGSCRTTTVAGQTEDSMAKRLVWNYFNRIKRPMRVLESTDTWTYATDTVRQARAQAANQLAVVVGVAEEPIEVSVAVMWSSDNAGDNASVAIGEDSTTTRVTGQIAPLVSTYIVNDLATLTASYRGYPAVGYHFYAWLERVGAGGTSTFYGDNGLSTVQSGISGWLG